MGSAQPSASGPFDAIVIGAGTGGLTAAALLARHGRSVLVLEQHAIPGGNATVFERAGYQFDVGVHYLGDCGANGMIPRVLRALGITGVEFRELDPDGFDTLVFPDFTFRVPRGVEAYRSRLLDRFPAEAHGIRDYTELIESTLALRSIGAGGMVSVRSLWHGLRVLSKRNRTLGQFLERRITDRKLRAVIAAQSGDYAAAPSRASLLVHAMVIGGYLMGAYYPAGGAQAITDRLVKVIRDCGGTIRVRARAQRIRIEAGRAVGVDFVDTPSGERSSARGSTVISGADLKHTMLELVGPEYLSSATRARVGGYTMAHALGVVYLGLRRDLRAEGMPNTNYWIHPGYDPESVYAAADAGRFEPSPPCYMFIASLHDPHNPRLAPAGCSNLQLVSVVPALPAAWGTTAAELASGAYRHNPAYLECKDRFADRLISAAERVIPGLRSAIALSEVASPLTHTRFTNSSGGTSYGIALTPEQFLMRRPPSATEVAGLYLCGASTRTGHGIPGTLMSGVLAASEILDRSVITRALRA